MQSPRIAKFPAGEKIRTSELPLALLVPAPLRTRRALPWLRATAADFALVGLNWLLIAAVLVQLRTFLPGAQFQAYASDLPISLAGIALLHAVLITLLGYTEGLYMPGKTVQQQAPILGKSVVWATVVLGVGFGIQRPLGPTLGLFGCVGLLHFGALWVWRWQSSRQQTADRPNGDERTVLIVGAGITGRRVASFFEEHPSAGRVVYGFLDDEYPLGEGVIGRVSELARLARTGFVDEVILAAPRDRNLTEQVVREATGLRLDVEIVPELFGYKLGASELERVGDLPVICLHAEQLPAAALLAKRMVDLVGAGLALLILSPLLLVVAILIKLDSPGPAFYSAQRAGRKGRLFRCHKFRTMVSNADDLKDQLRQSNERSGPIFKIAADPRITGVGRFLRRYSLDELPQLWNVLKGDMSLVGPRPHPADDYAAYEIEHLARLDVTPGITGLWQVTARRDASFQRGIELDREYIRTWSLRSDARILARTVLAVVRGSGE